MKQAIYPCSWPEHRAPCPPSRRARTPDTRQIGRGACRVISLSLTLLSVAPSSAPASNGDVAGWLHLLESHQHRLLGERLRAVPETDRGVEHYLLLAAMGGVDLLIGRPLVDLPSLEGEALPGVEQTVGEATDPGWRALGYRTLAATATLRGEHWRSRWLRWRASRAERDAGNDPNTALGVGIDDYVRWRAGAGDDALRAAGKAFNRCAAGGGLYAGVARIAALHVAREEGDGQRVLDLATEWDLSDIRHPLVLWAVGVAERQAGHLAGDDNQEAILHLNRASRAFSQLRFQVRSIPWPHYERGTALLDLYPHQRNDPDRFRTLEAAQQELEAYLAARTADGARIAEAHFHLGAIAELRRQSPAALTHYRLAAAAGHRQAQERLAAQGRGQ